MGLCHNEIDYNAKIQFWQTERDTIELECVLNGLTWWRLALSECF